LKGVSGCSAATLWVLALPTMQNNNRFLFFPPIIFWELWNEWLRGSREQLEGCFRTLPNSLGIGIANHAEEQPFFSSGNISGTLERMASRQQRAA